MPSWPLKDVFHSVQTSLVAQTVKRLPAVRETRVQSWLGKMSWRRKWQPTPVFLLGKPHGWISLGGYSPWGRKESDTIEWLHFHFSFSPVYILCPLNTFTITLFGESLDKYFLSSISEVFLMVFLRISVLIPSKRFNKFPLYALYTRSYEGMAHWYEEGRQKLHTCENITLSFQLCCFSSRLFVLSNVSLSINIYQEQ